MSNMDIDMPPIVSVPAMDINSALQEVLKKAVVANGIVHGIHQACKILDKRTALMCVLANSFDNQQYKNLIIALCRQHHIPLIQVDSHKKLGEWSGLCKIDSEGNARKVCGCSVVVVKDFGEETVALDVVKEHLRMDPI